VRLSAEAAAPLRSARMLLCSYFHATHGNPNFRDTSEPSSLSCELPECSAVITDSEDCPSSTITFSVSATACFPDGGIWDTCVQIKD